MQHNQFVQYNERWKNGLYDKPLIILIGGHIGTGKSTFAEMLRQKLTYASVTPTGIVRSVLQSLTTPDKNPELFLHTYDLAKLSFQPTLSEIENVVEGYKIQARAVDKGIRGLISFFESEGQMAILEGNHILPETAKELAIKTHIISVFFTNNDFDFYKQTISGPTHKRNLSKKQIDATRAIHDYIAHQALLLKLPVFDITQQDAAIEHINQQLHILNGELT